jgi:uncharacterized protein (TIGR02588 family)
MQLMNQNKKDHNPIERITFFMGLAVLAAIFSYLIYQLTQEKKDPPQLVVTSTYQPTMAHYGFEVRVRNKGEETAENASIKLSLYQDGKAVETGTINTAFVPVKSTTWIVIHTQRKPSDSLVVSSLILCEALHESSIMIIR